MFNCGDCNSRHVCKYKEVAAHLLKDLSELREKYFTTFCGTIDASCKHYTKEFKPTLR